MKKYFLVAASMLSVLAVNAQKDELKAASKALKKGDIKFKRRHFLWWEYDQLFQRLKKETDPELRKELRRNVDNKRKQIMLADNVYVENFLRNFEAEN